MAEFMQLTGFKELAAALRELPERVAKNALRSAVNAGASEIRKQAKANAPKDTGLLEKNIYQKQIREQSDATKQVFFVGVRGAKKKKKGEKKVEVPFYWRFIEFGTSKMPAKPFLRPAFDAKKEVAIERIGEKLDERIQKYAKELAKK